MKYLHRSVAFSFVLAAVVFFLSGSSASAAIVAQATTTAANASTGATTLVIGKPAFTAVGDVLIANVVFDSGASVVISPPSGWTLIIRTNEGSRSSLASYWKAASTSEPSSYTWTFNSSRVAVGGMTRYSGAYWGSPIDTSLSAKGNSSIASAPSITTDEANEMVVASFVTNANNTFGTASGMTELFDSQNSNANGPSTASDNVIKSTAGAIATTTSSLGATRRWIGQLIALRPFPTEDTFALCTDDIDNDFDSNTDLFDADCDAYIPRLTLHSSVINDNGGSYDGSILEEDIYVPNPAIPIPGTAVQNTGFTNVYRTGAGTPLTIKLNPGAYNFVRYYATYLSDAGYTSTTSADCASTLSAGQSKTCTLIFDDIAPQITVTKHVVNDSGGTSTAANFTIQVNTSVSVSSSTFPGSETGTNVIFATPGSYTITETGPSGYITATSSGCAGTLVLGQEQTCVITNSDVALSENTLALCTDETDNDSDDTTDLFDSDCEPFIPRLSLETAVINDNGGSFDGHIIESDIFVPNPEVPIPGTAVQNTGFTGVHREGGYAITLKLNPGAYHFVRYYSFSAGGYTSTTSASCDSTIAAGESKTCTLTFDDIAPQLLVTKHVINSYSGTSTAADFTISVNTAVSVSTSTFPGNESGTNVIFGTGGSYTITESGPSGYTTATSSGCSGSLAIGETQTCVITNSDTPLFENTLALCTDEQDNDGDDTTDLFDIDCDAYIPRLTLATAAVNDNGGSFDGHIIESDIFVPNPENPIPGTAVQNTGFTGVHREGGYAITLKLNPGAYHFVRYYSFSAGGYNSTTSADCDSTIAPGESKTCTLTFDDIAPSLVLLKQVVNDNLGTSTPSDWTVTATGPSVLSGAGGATSTSSFQAGSYTLSESSGPSGYTSVGWSCTGDVTNSGTSLAIGIGQSSVCQNTSLDN